MGLISLVGRLIGVIGLGISFIGLGTSYTDFIRLSIDCLISLVGLNGHIGFVNLGSTSLTSLVGLIGVIGCIGLNGHNDVIGLINKMEFEIPYYSFVRESWLWRVRRFFSLAGLKSEFFFGHALQYAKQVFLDRIPQMTK
jgi:hypothetical protein